MLGRAVGFFHYHRRIQEGRQERVPSGSKFFHFNAVFSKNLQNNRLAHPLWELAPPQENPGSATDYTLGWL